MIKVIFPPLAFMLGFIGLSLGGLGHANASYYVSTLPNVTLDHSLRTHIVISGKGNDLGADPEVAALAKAKKIAEENSGDQVLILNVESGENNAGMKFIRKFGFSMLRHESKLLDAKLVIEEMSKFNQIASLNTFGHSGIEPGIFLDGVGSNDLKWRANDPNTILLKGHFTADSYAIFNGCNAGHIEAPLFSKLWEIPVAGALTSSHFEVLFQDGSFYWADSNEASHFAERSQFSMRMRPDNADYHGMYGQYRQGLPIFKFFCNGLTQDRCLVGIKKAVYSYVSSQDLASSSSELDYLKVVREWLCPTGAFGGDTQKNCMAELERIGTVQSLSPSDRTYTPFRGASLQCTLKGCYSNRCEVSASSVSACAKEQVSQSGGETTTFVDEYLLYLKAFQVNMS